MAIGSIPKNAKLATLINYRVRVTSLDSRQFIGQLVSFDKHMNLVLSECEEFRLTKKSLGELKKLHKEGKIVDETEAIQEEKRALGLIILRGEQIVSVVVESAPTASALDPSVRVKSLKKGKGVAVPLKTDSVGASSSLSAPIRTNLAGSRVSKPTRGGFRKI
ncbi:unnamed protein product [Kuraishia capsulata CBS 1993]|uniref:Sm protein B n=1 Tax=Kuraishia capsulata CBS 1993 TaxID=1382522 RepID=W6MSD5_9ASCO|nr:uncharacterized protein KUCA_T00004098001 [Kuraishia capsulata CBS 1993]CDK28117.1 unnamed protein product [Kuraishia capsulata CBS 1993]